MISWLCCLLYTSDAADEGLGVDLGGRRIIKNPQILIFDDCLSAVDTETEEKILTNLEEVSKNKTTFIISHRVSSAKNADKIIILDEGEIIQQGPHNQLINEKGYYKELYEQQLLEKEN